jgi:hypothetical protein
MPLKGLIVSSNTGCPVGTQQNGGHHSGRSDPRLGANRFQGLGHSQGRLVVSAAGRAGRGTDVQRRCRQEPIVQALLAKDAALGTVLGTVLAFMVGVIALPLPELLILSKVLKLRLIAIFMTVVATGILIVGLIFRALL